jgi:hypothetical protein
VAAPPAKPRSKTQKTQKEPEASKQAKQLRALKKLEVSTGDMRSTSKRGSQSGGKSPSKKQKTH